jgi:hypothetical protein
MYAQILAQKTLLQTGRRFYCIHRSQTNQPTILDRRRRSENREEECLVPGIRRQFTLCSVKKKKEKKKRRICMNLAKNGTKARTFH